MRIIARLDKKLVIDPSSLIANYASHIWVVHARPLVDLHWDSVDYGWKLSMPNNSTKVLYSVAFGRNFMLS